MKPHARVSAMYGIINSERAHFREVLTEIINRSPVDAQGIALNFRRQLDKGLADRGKE